VSSILVVNGWIGLLVFIGNPWVAFVSEVLGAFFGTIVAIRLDKKYVSPPGPRAIGESPGS
jgi:hypothetical protein